ncbi:hypothetical protein [Terriglobus roseus]|uniref:Uncharacterized protein n=1 Tax=Terriglobus roseus TaxID=392734 RepID=A0A1H4J2S6_9BACT|nr:hypothetical protein [Terriglobus roseus]SEB40604.1 hypothetical protein SAMN05443244_0320 [Terriglobus roseus]
MALSTITVGGQTITLVDLPAPNSHQSAFFKYEPPGFRTVQWDIDDPAAVVTSGYGSQTQIQPWPGAESIGGTFSLVPLTQAEADQWISFLMALRGQANAFMIGDPAKTRPRGNPQDSVPLVTTATIATQNLPGSNQLVTRGWSGAGRLLEAGDWLQIGFRFYRNLFPVMSTDGTATLTVWPSLREQPTDATRIILHDCKGLFRLADSKRTWNADYTRLTTISFKFVEWRGAAIA